MFPLNLQLISMFFFTEEQHCTEAGTAFGETAFELESKTFSNGLLRQPLLRKQTVTYPPGTIPVVTESTQINTINTTEISHTEDAPVVHT